MTYQNKRWHARSGQSGAVMTCGVLLLAITMSLPELAASQLTISPTKSSAPSPFPIEPGTSPPTPPLVTPPPTPPLVTRGPTKSPSAVAFPTPFPSPETQPPPPTSSPEEAPSPTISPETPATNAPITSAPVSDPPTIAPETSAPTTFAPIKLPTPKPTTLAPTETPTETVITEEPTGKPITSQPTSQPTVQPTRQPTRKPTSSPTFSPSFPPTTDFPTVSPTDPPTKSPVTVPTTDSPSKSPTDSPSFPPSKKPTPAPTKSPSQTPSISPITSSPTASPNKAPTTESPTKSPSQTPIAQPTDDPTPAPSKSSSQTPTGSPVARVPLTVAPTAALSESPTANPIEAPETYSPTYMPVPIRSQIPTTKLIGPIITTNVKMTLNGVNEVPDDKEWSSTTASFIEEWLNKDLSGTSIIQTAVYDATVDVKVTSTTGSDGQRRLGRNLQTASVEVTYTQTTTYRTRDPNVEIERIIVAPFESQPSRDQYVRDLKELDGYASLTDVSPVTIAEDNGDNGNEITDPGEEKSGGGGVPLAAIIGGACGGAALLVLVGGFVYARRRKKKSESLSVEEAPSTKSQTAASELVTSGNSSVPTYGDQSVATVDYDYSKAYGGAGNYSLSDAGGTLGSRTRQTASDPALLPGADNTIYSDDPTFDQAYEGVKEELIDIYAPPGKLGVVIDTPDDGAPVVHAVKDTSPIADKVQVGDKLVAVDDEDVRAMTAIKVSKLISRKSANASRKLTVIRYVNQ
mmetsp:Transcript_763/g.1506  ORF Transcript_763/g.1506 Transcript_763/m.1506 type:complete len:745 (+) Transcript_763:238-2472(+)